MAPTGNRITTGLVRFSFVNIFTPRAGTDDSGNPTAAKYSLQILIPKTTADGKATYKRLRALEEKVKTESAAKWGGRVPKNLKSIIHDGDEEQDTDEKPEYAGHWYMSVNASERFKPGVVDANLEEILDPSEVYSGCYGKVSLTCFAYKGDKSSGISFGLDNVQKLKDGKPLGGVKAKATEDFDVEEWDDEDGDDDLV